MTLDSLEKGFNVEEWEKLAPALWTPLVDEQRELFAMHATIVQCKRGEFLFHEGETPKYLYYLISGKVVMWRKGIADQQQIVRMVEPGALFGYAAAFNGESYLSAAEVGADSDILKVPLRLVFHFIWENSSFAMLFLKELSALLGLSTERTMHLTQKHIRGRLAEILLTMFKKYGTEEDGQTLAVYVSREELGQMSNMTTSNAIRTLSAFASEGLVAIVGRKLKIIDEEGLQRISQMG